MHEINCLLDLTDISLKWCLGYCTNPVCRDSPLNFVKESDQLCLSGSGSRLEGRGQGKILEAGGNQGSSRQMTHLPILQQAEAEVQNG